MPPHEANRAGGRPKHLTIAVMRAEIRPVIARRSRSGGLPTTTESSAARLGASRGSFFVSSFLLVLHANVRNLDEVHIRPRRSKEPPGLQVPSTSRSHWTPSWSELFIRRDHCSSPRGGSQSPDGRPKGEKRKFS